MNGQRPVLSNESDFELMIRLALDREEENEINDLIGIREDELGKISSDRAEKLWNKCRLFIRKGDKRKKPGSSAGIAACAALLFCFLLAAVFANSAWFGTKGSNLIADRAPVGNESADGPDGISFFNMPSSWKGEYYPEKIPDGFSVVPNGNEDFCLELWDGRDHVIFIEEADPHGRSWIGAAGTEGKFFSLNDRPVLLFESSFNDSRKSCTAVVDLGDRYFVVSTYNMTSSETIGIAGSVRRISGRMSGYLISES